MLLHSQVVTGHLPYLTKGPFALFYGGAEIVPLLSSDPAGNPFSIVYLVSLPFLISLLIYKKLKMRKLPTQQRLKELVVNNFLNVYSMIIMLAIVIIMAVTTLIHYKTITKNSILPKDKIPKSPEDYWTDLLMLAMVETMCQSIAFITNPALRQNKTLFITIFPGHSC